MKIDKEERWTSSDGIWILRTTRQWLPRDLDLLRPIFDRMRTEGPDFLNANLCLAEEIRLSLTEIDAIEEELMNASKAIASASGLVAKYKTRLGQMCDSICATRVDSVDATGISDRCVALGA